MPAAASRSGGSGQGGSVRAASGQELSPAAQGALAHFGQAGVSPDGTVGYATVTYTGKKFDDVEHEQPDQGVST